MTDEQKQETRDRIGHRIAALRRLRKMTQEELATAAGLQRTHVEKKAEQQIAV